MYVCVCVCAFVCVFVCVCVCVCVTECDQVLLTSAWTINRWKK